jgi:dihydroorotate dehydrogenase
MAAHKTSAIVQEKACRALGNLSAQPANRDAVSAAGGIEALATAMDTHQARALLQEYACAALHNLAINASLRGRIKAAGGVELAKRAVSASDATANTKDCGKQLLDFLA